VVGYFYASATLLDFDARRLQQTGEHSEGATLPNLTEIGLVRYGVIPLWNPYMMTGFPYAGDLISNLYNPIATIPVLLWGGVSGMKVSVFLALVVAGLGQWALGFVLGLRSPMRLWSALLVMLSGGLGLFWRVGWYQLLIGRPGSLCLRGGDLGAAFGPARRAGRGRAGRRDATHFVGRLLRLHLGGSLLPVVLLAVAFASRRRAPGRRETGGDRLALSAPLLAVVFLPVVDVYRLASEAPADPSRARRSRSPTRWSITSSQRARGSAPMRSARRPATLVLHRLPAAGRAGVSAARVQRPAPPRSP
jgi:hypothetical protein